MTDSTQPTLREEPKPCGPNCCLRNVPEDQFITYVICSEGCSYGTRPRTPEDPPRHRDSGECTG
jgi:hypothetical protein